MKKIYLFVISFFCFFLFARIPPVKAQSNIDFGDVPVGSTAQKTFFIRNKGTVTDSGMDIRVYAPFYRDSPQGRFTIKAGDSIAVTLSFKPNFSGQVSTTTLFYSSFSGWSPGIELTGNGIPASAVSQTVLNHAAILRIYPNPVIGNAAIAYTIASYSPVTIEICDLLGHHIRTLSNDMEDAGSHTASFDAGSLTAGSYIIRLITNAGQSITKLEIIR